MERRRLQDIFLPFPSGATAGERRDLEILAEELLARLHRGTDFASIARRHSRGPGADKGGDLGYFAKGELDTVLERAVENLEEGETTPVVKAEMGLHIIKVSEIDQRPPRSLEEVRETIRRRLYQQVINRKYKQWLDDLRQRSYVKVVEE
jgi:peptidyl-prolyl cis-trans isomerase SurA